jgi:hypothetical protein
LLEQFRQVSLFCLHIWIWNTSTIFISSFILSLCPLTSHWYPDPDKNCSTLLSFIFLKVYIDSPRGFTLVLHVLIKLTLL